MDELVDFIKARLDEDEAVVGRLFEFDRDNPDSQLYVSNDDTLTISGGRVLREVEAKRRILGEIAPLVGFEPREDFANTDNVWAEIASERAERLLRLLALPYSDHEQFREEWKP